MRHRYFTIRMRQLCILPLLLVFLPPPLVLAGDDRQQGLLWEIAAPGQPPGYLFGTIHSGEPAVLALPEPVQQAFDAADSVVLEVLLDLDAMRDSSQLMLLGDGRLLSDITGQALFEQTSRAIRARGIPDVVLERMKPWAAAVTLSMPAPEAGAAGTRGWEVKRGGTRQAVGGVSAGRAVHSADRMHSRFRETSGAST